MGGDLIESSYLKHGGNREIKYEPIPVKQLLIEMKNLSELMVDLSYYSVIYGDRELAKEVFELETRIDELRVLLTMQVALATRSKNDAEKMVSIYAIASATDKISDSAADIARIALRRMRIPKGIATVAPRTSETITVIEIREEYDGMNLGAILCDLKSSIDVIAIRRGRRIFLEPPIEFKVEKGDILILRGLIDSINKLATKLKLKTTTSKRVKMEKYIPIFDMLEHFRRTSRLSIDLAYVAVLTRSHEVAEKVLDIESYTDTLLNRFCKEILEDRELSVQEKLGSLWIAIASENITDAAAEMVEPLLRGLEPHPLITDILEEADERISVVEMDKTDEGFTLKELGYVEKGISILAVRRGDEWYIMPPYSSFRVKEGDILIVKYSMESKELIDELEKEEDREEIIEEIQEEEWRE